MIEIKQGTVENVDLIQPLWEKLIQLHYELPPHWNNDHKNKWVLLPNSCNYSVIMNKPDRNTERKEFDKYINIEIQQAQIKLVSAANIQMLLHSLLESWSFHPIQSEKIRLGK